MQKYLYFCSVEKTDKQHYKGKLTDMNYPLRIDSGMNKNAWLFPADNLLQHTPEGYNSWNVVTITIKIRILIKVNQCIIIALKIGFKKNPIYTV